jgi:hypothetical protein
MKPVDDFYGFSADEANVLIAGLLANQSLVDNRNGTISDTVTGLDWDKCTVGQVYRAEQNDCLGAAGTGTALNPSDLIGAGASAKAFCDSRTHACNSLDFPQLLQGISTIAIAGTSELFGACAEKGGNWRVPNPLELKRLTVPGRAATLVFFPSTQEDEYWTSWSNSNDLPGETAISVSFDRESYGVERNTVKTQRNYVRCVRNRS